MAHGIIREYLKLHDYTEATKPLNAKLYIAESQSSSVSDWRYSRLLGSLHSSERNLRRRKGASHI